MRVVYVLSQDLESPSGLGRYFPLARQLARRGHHVHISAVHPNYQALQNKRFLLDDIEVSYVAPMHVRKQGNLKHYYGTLGLLKVTIQATWGLSAELLRSDATIIHVGKPHPMNSVAGILGGIRSHHKLCVDCDDYEAGSMHFSSAWQKWLVSQFEQYVPRIGKLVTVNTHFMRDKLMGWGVASNKIVYLPNGVDQERFSKFDPGRIDGLRQSFGLTGKKVIAYLGSMSLPSHPVDLLLKAFKIILNRLPETKLLLVGAGGDYPTVVEEAAQMGLADSVIFTGRVPPEDIPNYYRLADVTVDPVYDNDAARGRSPLKLFESWASGVPFVTSKVGDRIDLLDASQSGILTEECTAEAYAKAILDVISSVTLAEIIRNNGLQEVQQYTWEHLSIRLEQAYQNIQTER